MAKKTSSGAISARRMPEEKRYMAQDDLRTLQRAQEIQSDRKRMAACKTEARMQMASLSKAAK